MNKKVILLTGASSGLGKDAVLDLLKKGHTVYAAARRVEKMEELRQRGARILSMDVTKDEQVTAGIEKILKEEGRIDVLVNNAGSGGYGMIEAVSMEEAYLQFEVNVFGPARLVKAVLPQMRKQKSGSIINISSVVGRVSSPMIGWYSASKQALEGWTDALRGEVKGWDIKVVLIEPGAVQTGFRGKALEKLETVEHPVEYQTNVNAFKTTVTKNYSHTPGPKAVVRTLVHAIESKKPRTRYAVGIDSKMAILMRALFSDKAIDNIMRMIYRME